MKNNPSTFLNLLDAYVSKYLPISVGASPNTIKSYKTSYRLLIEFMYKKKNINAEEITFDILNQQTLLDFLEWLAVERSCSASTKNQRLSALVSFSLYAQNRDFEAATIFRNSICKIPIKKTQHKQRAVFTLQEVKILLDLPDERREIGLRDKVLLSFMYATGARVQEVCDLEVGKIYFNDKGATINLIGKGNKIRRIGIPAICATMLNNYIRHRKIHDRPERHLFSSQTHEKMTVSCIEGIFAKYVKLAKMNYPDMFTQNSYPPHSMRHSTASHMLESGVPMVVIKNFLGHASLQITQIYAELSQSTIDKHLKEWNEKWFPSSEFKIKEDEKNEVPDFLK
mgnify:CR=1 FL=1